MNSHSTEEINIPNWVEKAEGNDRFFREAVHIILSAISTSIVLHSTMIMKGGMLMAIRYNSSRFTRDADFSTRNKYLLGNEVALIEELKNQIDIVNEELSYETICRYQRHELRPKKVDASFPTLTISVGFARRTNPSEMRKLNAGQAIRIVSIDYSYNEAVFDVEVLKLSEGESIQAYSFLNLLAEKYRSLLQQPIRNRNREQDVYDINILLGSEKNLSAEEKKGLLTLLVNSSSERDIDAKKDSIADVEVRSRAEKGYEALRASVEGELIPFEESYEVIQKLYESLPWDNTFQKENTD